MGLFNGKDELVRGLLANHMEVHQRERKEDREDAAIAKAELNIRLSKIDNRLETVDNRLGSQDTSMLKMHEENRAAREADNKSDTNRFVGLLLMIIGAMLSPYMANILRYLQIIH